MRKYNNENRIRGSYDRYLDIYQEWEDKGYRMHERLDYDAYRKAFINAKTATKSGKVNIPDPAKTFADSSRFMTRSAHQAIKQALSDIKEKELTGELRPEEEKILNSDFGSYKAWGADNWIMFREYFISVYGEDYEGFREIYG